MNIILEAHSKVYWLAGFGWLVIDYFILPRVLSLKAWLDVRMPSTIAHESAHFLMALVLGAEPRMNFDRHIEDDGTIQMAGVEFGPPIMGEIGRTLIASAPLWLGAVALWIGFVPLAQPQPLGIGLLYLATGYVLLDAAALSRADFGLMGISGKVSVISALALVALLAGEAIFKA